MIFDFNRKICNILITERTTGKFETLKSKNRKRVSLFVRSMLSLSHSFSEKRVLLKTFLTVKCSWPSWNSFFYNGLRSFSNSKLIISYPLQLYAKKNNQSC